MGGLLNGFYPHARVNPSFLTSWLWNRILEKESARGWRGNCDELLNHRQFSHLQENSLLLV